MVLAVWFVAVSPFAVADVVIDVHARGMNTQLMMNEHFARMDNAADGSYLLFDRRSGESYLVLPKSRQVMAMTRQAGNSGQRLQVQLLEQADGRQLLGYASRRYRMMVNNRYCGEVLASTQAMSQLDIKPLLDAVATLAEQQLAAMGFYVSIIDECTRASMQILSHSDRIGLPLRIYDNRGGLLSDITGIDTQVKLDQTLLSIPEGYARVASVSQLSPTEHLIQNARRHVPAIDEAYRRMFVR